MRDEGWLLLIGVVVVFLLIRQSLKQRPPARQKSDDTGGVQIPPVPEPTHVRGVLIGEAQLADPAIASEIPPKKPRPKTTQTADPITNPPRKRPPLTGQDRIDWQANQRAEQQRKTAEDQAARRIAAKQLQEEKAAREKIEKAKGMAAAEARMAVEAGKKLAASLKATIDKERDQQRRDYLRTQIPNRIQRDMDRFLAGEFQGPEQSPLTYVGYHVGVARGLSERDRIERLEVCFRVPIPNVLYAEYRDWGEPATTQRLNAMIAHIGKHAAIRSTQSKYARAVAEWEADRAWLLSSLGPKANAFSERWLG